MEIQEKIIIGDLVANDYRAASVFKKYGIDFCCNGNRTLSDACEAENVDINNVITDLNDLSNSLSKNETDYLSWPIDLLVDYIEKKHHRYVDDKISEIKPYLQKICDVHGNEHPELSEINELFNDAAGELTAHMKKEELILFPFVRKMVQAKDGKSSLGKAHFGTVENPIQMMKHEHTNEGERFRKIEKLSNGYTPPSNACNTYKVTFSLLQEFEADLHLHIHLENNILFPKAIQLEKELI